MSAVSRGESLPGVHAEPSKIKEASWKDYAVRFGFGGVITVVVGILGKAFGPVVAGLFLAFPAILPASLTLISKHDGDRKASLDALGAGPGSVGLVAFGLAVWKLAPVTAGWIALLVASVAWFLVSLAAWGLLERFGRSG